MLLPQHGKRCFLLLFQHFRRQKYNIFFIPTSEKCPKRVFFTDLDKYMLHFSVIQYVKERSYLRFNNLLFTVFLISHRFNRPNRFSQIYCSIINLIDVIDISSNYTNIVLWFVLRCVGAVRAGTQCRRVGCKAAVAG